MKLDESRKKFNLQLVSSNVEAGDETRKNTAASAMGGSSAAKQIGGRRGKTTDRREASTKRWVARKRALLAATGKNETETDSESSDEAQLSPVQKARAKCKAEKVAAESQRRTANSLKSLDGSMANNCDGENDESTKEKKLALESGADSKLEEQKEKPEEEEVKPAKNRANENANQVKKSVILSKEESFLPHSVQSELTVDEATFIVTSTLVLTEPHLLTRVSDLPKDNNALQAPEATNQERNTDIIDAVQLRRVSPKPTVQNDKKLVERCLNIEVEGTELEALKRVQEELANFVETKLIMELESRSSWKVEPKKQPSQSLNQQLKTIIEKSIEKNLSMTRRERSVMRGENTFSPEFVRAAMRSKIFQPRVVLVRYEAKENKVSLSNEQPVVAVKKTIQVPMASLGKRKSILPAKYADYEASPFGTTASDDEKDTKRTEAPVSAKFNRHKTYGPAMTKVPIMAVNELETRVVPESRGTAAKSNAVPNREKNALTEANVTATMPPAKSRVGGKHICGVCGDSFGTRREVEIHFSAHTTSIPTIRQVKQKMMRCKRCHEIVEARYVKLHVCNSSITRTSIQTVSLQKLPDERSQNPRGVSGLPVNKPSLVSPAALTSNIYTCFVCDKTFEDERILKDHLQKHCDDISDEEEEEEEGEGEMGDGEEEAIAEKELYQCAICGESLYSEDALETHVEKHLFDDEDDNPNLISIGEREKTKKHEIIHVCNQCNEPFDSEMLLMLHMQAHEEEIAIAEWERRGAHNSQVEQHICVICDQMFPTEAELSEHLDVHNGNAHVCLLCDKPFLTLEELQAHVNTH